MLCGRERGKTGNFMTTTIIITIVAAIVAVGLFMLGMSLTQIIKGHPIQSEIADNPNMQKLGIKCAAQQMREEERALYGGDSCDSVACTTHNCSTCGATHSKPE